MSWSPPKPPNDRYSYPPNSPRPSRSYYQTDFEPLSDTPSRTHPSENRETQKPQKEAMFAWLERQASSPPVQIAATAVLSGAAVAGTILGYQAIRRREAVEDLKASIPALDDTHKAEKLSEYGIVSPPTLSSKEDERGAALAKRAQKGEYDEELIQEQLARNKVFLTPEGLSKLRSSFIIIVGLGGVGSHAATALARSGVSRIRLVDFDQVTLSSLNRHAVATLADVGTPKTSTLKRRLEQITPWTRFDLRNELFNTSSADRLLGPWDLASSPGHGDRPSFVIDAIDNISTKVSLLEYCYNHSIPVISSMGAATKADPTRLIVADISLSTDDPLSKSTRRRLKALGIQSGIPVIFSTEKPAPGKAEIQPLPEMPDVGDLAPLKDFRVRILPVLGTMPAVFGYTAANFVICRIVGYPVEYNNAPMDRWKMYDAILANLQGLEERLARTEKNTSSSGGSISGAEDAIGLRIPITAADVAFLVEEVFKGKSVVSGLGSRLALVRWQRPRLPLPLSQSSPSSDQGMSTRARRRYGPDPELSVNGQKVVRLAVEDLVLMTKEEAQRHEREILRGEKEVDELYGEEVRRKVEARRQECREWAKWR